MKKCLDHSNTTSLNIQIDKKNILRVIVTLLLSLSEYYAHLSLSTYLQIL